MDQEEGMKRDEEDEGDEGGDEDELFEIFDANQIEIIFRG